MKEMIKLAVSLGVASILCSSSTTAQVRPPDQPLEFMMRSGPRPGTNLISPEVPRYVIPGKRASEYTVEDWGHLIDSTWGPGQSYFDQLDIFDGFWTLVDEQWAGFPNTELNWDSVGNYYRPQIYDGMSRGRFFALMSRVALSLRETHSRISDLVVDTCFTSGGFEYRRGVPLLLAGSIVGSLLGAAVTPLPDSTNLVYRVGPENPLGLEPGDLVLGYDGVRWATLFQQLIDAGLPISNKYSGYGSTPESITYMNLLAVSCNWGLFDTIDVVKYSSGDTLHLSTALLEWLTEWVYHSDQVPVAGVPMPKNRFPWGTEAVSWGVVEGTNVGYIYVWDWMTIETQELFAAAVDSLIHGRRVEGLILDFRMNWGGYWYGHKGLSRLFNENPTTHHQRAKRTDVSNHYGFTLYPPYTSTPTGSVTFLPTTEPFDGPVAVLTGPSCFSAGEYYCFFMRYFPYARSFGRPTNGGFVGGDYADQVLPEDWDILLPTSIAYSLEPGEGYLIHAGFQPDEEVWLTRDGVARGEDDVVKRALEWISEFTHAHDVVLDRTYALPGSDSICVTTILTNPLSHDAELTGLVSPVGGTAQDSVALHDDGLHGDGSANDSLWGAYVHAPAGEAQDVTENGEGALLANVIDGEDKIYLEYRHIKDEIKFKALFFLLLK